MANRVELRWSGATNVSAGTSLGGAISSYAISGQTMTGFDAIAGVSFVDSYGPAGSATLFFDQSATTLQYTAPSGSAGAAVSIAAGGRFSLYSGYSYMVVDVVLSALPAADVTATMTASNIDNLFFDDAQAAESRTEYVCNYVYAVSAVTALSVGVTQPNGVGSLAIGDDPAGISGTAITITGNTIAPVGVTFAATDIVIGDLTAGQSAAFWLRRIAGGSQSGTSATAQTYIKYT